MCAMCVASCEQRLRPVWLIFANEIELARPTAYFLFHLNSMRCVALNVCKIERCFDVDTIPSSIVPSHTDGAHVIVYPRTIKCTQFYAINVEIEMKLDFNSSHVHRRKFMFCRIEFRVGSRVRVWFWSCGNKIELILCRFHIRIFSLRLSHMLLRWVCVCVSTK